MQNRSIVAPSDRQKVFVEALLEGHGAVKASKIAGYAEGSAHQPVKGLFVNGQLRGHAREIIRGKIDIEGAPEAYRVLMALLRDDTTAKSIKVDIAKFLISHSIPPLKATTEDAKDEKEPSQMSNEELQAYITKTDKELSKRGKLIDVTPDECLDSII